MNIEVKHDEAAHRFFCVVEGHECAADYDVRGDIIDIHRTFVHPDLRGRGIAEILMKAFSDYAAASGLKVFPSCSYAVLYYKRHSEYAAVLSEDANLENGGGCRLPERRQN
jgi:predicted GNAT family acetyltransferase